MQAMHPICPTRPAFRRLLAQSYHCLLPCAGVPTEAAAQLSSGSFGQSGDSTTTSALAAVKAETPDASADVHTSPSSAGDIAAGQQREQVAAR